MRVKRFVADDIQTAIAQVKADFGREAVILHTKRFKRGGLWGWFGKERVEVIAAVDPAEPARLAEAARREAAVEVPYAEIAAIRRELDELKRRLAQPPAMPADSHRPPPAPPALRHLRERLLAHDVAPEHLEVLLDDVVAVGSAAEHGQQAWVWTRAAEVINAHVRFAPPWSFARKPWVVVLVGPTGVGKTTTIAKLAANYALLAGKRVALATVDTYRIAAVEQLKTYADIIDVPVEVAFTPAELEEAITQHQDADLILVDTAGRSQRNQMHMAELKAFLDVLPEPEVHLVVSATTRFREMEDVIARFGQVGFSCLVVTKLDETVCWGGLVNAAMSSGRPLSYVTTGQNVPDDIEVAESEKLIAQLLGPEEPAGATRHG